MVRVGGAVGIGDEGVGMLSTTWVRVELELPRLRMKSGSDDNRSVVRSGGAVMIILD